MILRIGKNTIQKESRINADIRMEVNNGVRIMEPLIFIIINYFLG